MKKVAPYIIGFVVVVLGVYVGIDLYFRFGAMPGTNSNTLSPSDKKVVPSEAMGSNNPDISGITYESNDVFSDQQEFLFSFQHPAPGPYCNGCFSGMSGIAPVQINTISGGYMDTSGDAKWMLIYGIFPAGESLADGAMGIPTGEFFAQLDTLAVGDEGVFTTEGKQVTYTRVADVEGLNVPMKIYVTDGTTWFETRSVATFTLNGTNYYFGFETIDPMYSDVFETAIRSIQLEPRVDATEANM